MNFFFLFDFQRELTNFRFDFREKQILTDGKLFAKVLRWWGKLKMYHGFSSERKNFQGNFPTLWEPSKKRENLFNRKITIKITNRLILSLNYSVINQENAGKLFYVVTGEFYIFMLFDIWLTLGLMVHRLRVFESFFVGCVGVVESLLMISLSLWLLVWVELFLGALIFRISKGCSKQNLPTSKKR